MQTSRILGGTLLVAGTAIGAGMLILPISTGLAGLFPSLLLILVSWFFMTFTAFLVLEITLWQGGEADLISMAEKTLGNGGKLMSGATYLLLLYSLTAAYISGSSKLIAQSFFTLTGFELAPWMAPFPMILLFGSFVYLGTKPVDLLNRFLMIGLSLTYALLVAFVPSHIETSHFAHQEWDALSLTTAVVLTSFGFHVIIPTLSSYLNHDKKLLQKSLLIGSSLPLFIYIIWEFLILGVVPLQGEHSLIAAWSSDLPATEPLKNILNMPWIGVGAQFFAFFSITTSFLGVSLSLSHFLADGLKIKKNKVGSLAICLLTFVPPLTFVLTGSRAFYVALEYAGIFVAILLGILPIAMAWNKRYHQGATDGFSVRGGKPLLIIAMIFFIFVVFTETANKLHYFDFTIAEYIH